MTHIRFFSRNTTNRSVIAGTIVYTSAGRGSDRFRLMSQIIAALENIADQQRKGDNGALNVGLLLSACPFAGKYHRMRNRRLRSRDRRVTDNSGKDFTDQDLLRGYSIFHLLICFLLSLSLSLSLLSFSFFFFHLER